MRKKTWEERKRDEWFNLQLLSESCDLNIAKMVHQGIDTSMTTGTYDGKPAKQIKHMNGYVRDRKDASHGGKTYTLSEWKWNHQRIKDRIMASPKYPRDTFEARHNSFCNLITIRSLEFVIG